MKHRKVYKDTYDLLRSEPTRRPPATRLVLLSCNFLFSYKIPPPKISVRPLCLGVSVVVFPGCGSARARGIRVLRIFVVMVP